MVIEPPTSSEQVTKDEGFRPSSPSHIDETKISNLMSNFKAESSPTPDKSVLSGVSNSLKKFLIKKTTKQRVVKNSSSESDSDEGGTTHRAAGLPPVDLLLKHIEQVKKTHDTVQKVQESVINSQNGSLIEIPPI